MTVRHLYQYTVCDKLILGDISTWLIKNLMPIKLHWIQLSRHEPENWRNTQLHPQPFHSNSKRGMEAKKREREESQDGSKGRERCYDRNEKPTHVHINVLHSTMSPSHRKKGSIYRQHSSPTVPSACVSEERVVFPLQGLSSWRILLVYREDP